LLFMLLYLFLFPLHFWAFLFLLLLNIFLGIGVWVIITLYTPQIIYIDSPNSWHPCKESFDLHLHKHCYCIHTFLVFILDCPFLVVGISFYGVISFHVLKKKKNKRHHAQSQFRVLFLAKFHKPDIGPLSDPRESYTRCDPTSRLQFI